MEFYDNFVDLQITSKKALHMKQCITKNWHHKSGISIGAT